MNDSLLKKLLWSGLLLALVFSLSNCKKNNAAQEKAQELKKLDNLKAEIVKLSAQGTCDGNTEWKYVAVLSGSCSNAEYIPYSTAIDRNSFLQKVTIYNEMLRDFNAKWNVNIDCALIEKLPPKGVTCVDGKAKLVY